MSAASLHVMLSHELAAQPHPGNWAADWLRCLRMMLQSHHTHHFQSTSLYLDAEVGEAAEADSATKPAAPIWLVAFEGA